MKSVPDELATLLAAADFDQFHSQCGDQFKTDLRRFLTATMDEIRIIASSRVALEILKTIGIADSAKFREAVLRRELLGTIAYEKQRDHSSHTLYNYLLGWYFFSRCDRLKDALIGEFAKRAVPHATLEPFQDNNKYFGCVWQYASLLHDIGYMFEGSLSRMAFETSSKQAEIGARVAHEYFNRAVWLEYGIDLPVMRVRLFDSLGPDFQPPSYNITESLGDIADELRTVGSLESLLLAVDTTLDGASEDWSAW